MAGTAHFFLVLTLALGLTACSNKPRIAVGSKNFTEQVVLGEIVAQQIERRLPVEVERVFGLGGTLLAHEALKSGSIDIYPEYTGTALTAILKQPASKDPANVLNRVRNGYKPWSLSWLPPFGFNNTFAMVVRADTAEKDHLSNLSAASERSQPWKLGVGYEFVERRDGLTGLQKTYGLRLDGDPITMDLGLLYPALRKGNIDMGAGSATDAFLTDATFKMLPDDKHYFPPYECALVVRDETLAKFPALRGALEELSGNISNKTMRQLNAAVDLQHRSVREVAQQFLASLPAPPQK